MDDALLEVKDVKNTFCSTLPHNKPYIKHSSSLPFTDLPEKRRREVGCRKPRLAMVKPENVSTENGVKKEHTEKG